MMPFFVHISVASQLRGIETNDHYGAAFENTKNKPDESFDGTGAQRGSTGVSNLQSSVGNQCWIIDVRGTGAEDSPQEWWPRT